MQFSDHFPARLVGAIAVFALVLNTAHAKDDGTDFSVTIEKDIQTNVINADGSFVMTRDSTFLINEERAIKVQAQKSLSYNRSLETLEVIEAYTQKPDGRRVEVKADQIKEQQERESSEAPMFQDTLVKAVIFPEVAVGDRLVLQYKVRRTTALFPKQFEDLSYPAFHPTQQFTLIYDLPETMLLYADAKGFTATRPAAAAGRKIYRWDYVPGKNARIEQGAVSYLDYGQYLAVSTFANFNAFAQAYDARAKSTLTPEVVKLAKSITANLDSPRAKAIALSDWVRKNIRYVAVYIGAGGVVPHPVDTILANRYGDCKDHVALLEALLTAAAIESTPALINLGNAYALPEVPTLGVLNHVITYIPSLDLYLDSTAEAIAGGYLPIPDLDKPVVLTKSGERGRTPFAQEGKVENTTVFNVSATGAADFTHSSSIEGWGAEFNRYFFKSMMPEERNLLIQQILTSYGQTGGGKLQTGTLEGNVRDFEIKMAGRTENLVNLPGPIGVPTMTSFAGGIAQNVFGFAAENQRIQAFTCISGVMEEQARFEFPEDVGILAAPKPVSLRHANFDYRSTYVKEANAVVVHRRFTFNHPSAVCSPDDFKVMKPAIDAMVNDLKSQIIVHSL
jgi:transglutaminase-like putative cysteine protease